MYIILSLMSHFQNVFYSRKNYKKPELQISPHQTFEEEVTLLDSLFPGNYRIHRFFLSITGKGKKTERQKESKLKLSMLESIPPIQIDYSLYVFKLRIRKPRRCSSIYYFRWRSLLHGLA